MEQLILHEVIEKKIFLIRGQRVMLDKDLADMYGVKPIRLREQVKRNILRFPDDFMIKLNNEKRIGCYRNLRYHLGNTLVVIILMFLQNKGLLCYRQF